MYRRTLPREAVLWWRGDPAQSLGVVESGRLAVRGEAGLIDVLPAGSVVGESALLEAGGAPPRRSADVVVVDEGTVVVEYPLDELPGTLAQGLPQLVLRSLLAQAARNFLVVAAAHPDDLLVGAAVDGFVDLLEGCAGRLPDVQDWERFQAAFRLFYRMREGSDAARRDLVPAEEAAAPAAQQVLDTGRYRLADAGLASLLEACLRADAERPGRA